MSLSVSCEMGSIGRSGGRRRATVSRPAWSVVAHLDLDAFFAAVEVLEQPGAGLPPARRGRRPARPRRGGHRELRGAALRYPLRDELRRGAPPLPAGRLHPAATWPCTGATRGASGLLVREVFPTVEQTGIDEGYLDLAEVVDDFRQARGVARRSRSRSAARPGSRAPSACGTCKVVAKVASDRRKPGGVRGRPAGRRGGVPRAVLRAGAAGRRAARRGAAAPRRHRDDRRRWARSPTRRWPGCSRGRSGGSCATARSASTRVRSTSRSRTSRSARRRRSPGTWPIPSSSARSCAGCRRAWPSSSPAAAGSRAP